MSKGNIISTTKLWVIGIAIVLILWAGSWLYLLSCYSSLNSWSERGSFGDSFGAVNSLFSGLAFVALTITIYLQIRGLRDTKQEGEIRAFESKFFQLIRVHINIIEGIERYQTGNLIRGRQWLSKLYENLSSRIESELANVSNGPALEVVQRTYGTFFENNEHHLGHYFRHLYHIVAFIDRSSIDPEKKMTYIKLIRAQLSSHELLLLFYNCLSKRGINKFKPLVEKYSLLEHIPKVRDDLRNLYAPSAFVED